MKKLVHVICLFFLFSFITVGDQCSSEWSEGASDSIHAQRILVDCDQEHSHQAPESFHVCHIGHCPWDLPRALSVQRFDQIIDNPFLVFRNFYFPPSVFVRKPPPRGLLA